MERKHKKDPVLRKFRRQLFHASLSAILQPLKPGMTTPEITRCPDGHLRKVIYGLGPYIADYPEQVLAACIVQGWCPTCLKDPEKFDDADASGQRFRAHTEALIDSHFSANTLWKDYGIVSDIIVRML